jgi:hypothetical protein
MFNVQFGDYNYMDSVTFTDECTKGFFIATDICGYAIVSFVEWGRIAQPVSSLSSK